MANGNGDAQLRVPEAEGNGSAAELTTAEVLRLLSAGAGGSILMALAEGPLRTKELTERIPGYAPRTIYRYAGRLTEIGVIEREEEPGVPSKVVHSLSDPCGRELYDLINAFANTSLGRLPSGEIGAPEWGSLGLLADFWESGMIEELNREPRSLTELSRGQHSLSSAEQTSEVATLLLKLKQGAASVWRRPSEGERGPSCTMHERSER